MPSSSTPPGRSIARIALQLFNLYFIKGEKASILIEAGISSIVDIVKEQMEKLKISPDFIVVTHPHSDHITGLDGLRSIYPDAVPIAGPGAVEFFTHPKAVQAMISEDMHMTDRLNQWGFKSNRPPVTKPPSRTDIKIMADESELDLGGITARDEFRVYSRKNIFSCIRILIQRSRSNSLTDLHN